MIETGRILMNAFPILISSTFEKSLPRNEKEEILGQIAAFSKAWQESKSHPENLVKYGIDKVEGRTFLKEVWKFKISKGDRILFVKGRHIPWNTAGYEDALVFLAYCTHDEQIRRARSQTDTGEILSIDDFADEVGQNMIYDPERSSTKVFKHLDIHKLIHVDQLKGIFYLNKEQSEYVNKDYSPAMLFGTAGSGKTTIGVYKMIGLMKQNANLRVGYFTYSEKLLSTAKQIYETVLDNEVRDERGLRGSQQIDFYSMRDFLRYHTHTKKIVEYEGSGTLEGFKAWCNALKIQPKYKRFIEKAGYFDIWKDIRGIIKGFAQMNWDVNKQSGKDGLLSLEAYLALKPQYTHFNEEERHVLHEICLHYTEWLEEMKLYDENDLSRQLLNNLEALPQYDWLIIDEVQDLTEVQIYLLYSLLNNKANILISGDYHQTITPTYFDTRRIKSLFIKEQLEAWDLPLQNNYRNPKVIVQAANQIGKLRAQAFGKDKRNDKEEYAMSDEEGALFLLSNKNEKIKLLQVAVEKAYVYVVVPNEEEKIALESLLKVDSGIYTVSEIKGLENEYIIGVNFFKAYEKEWEHLFKVIQGQEVMEETCLDSYLFNMLYVVLTRAEKYVCLIDDFDHQLIDLLFEHKKILNRFDEESFNLAKQSTQQERYRSAYKLEQAQHYEAAMKQYRKLTTAEAKTAITRCQAGLLVKEGDYEGAAKLYLQIRHMAEVIHCYKMARNKEAYFKYLLLYDPKGFTKEILMNPTCSYKKDIKPFIKESGLKDKLQQLIASLYGHKLQNSLEEKQLLIWEIEESTEKIKGF